MTKVLLTGSSGYIGKHIGVNSSSTKRDLGITFAPIEESLVETANYLVDNGFVKS